MKVQLKLQLLKFCLVLLNSVFLVLGLSVSGCGLWILFDSRSFLTAVSSVELQTVAVGLLVIGGVVTAVSVLGCVGADGGNRVLLLTYLGFLIVLVLAQVFITLLLLLNRNKIEVGLSAAVDHIMVHYQGGSVQDTLMDSVQQHGRCCGRTGPADWLKNSYVHSLNLTALHLLPCSCFAASHSVDSSWCSELNSTLLPVRRGNSSYDQGCGAALSDWLQENALTIVGMDVSLMLLQVLQFVVVVNLYLELGRIQPACCQHDNADLKGPAHHGGKNNVDWMSELSELDLHAVRLDLDIQYSCETEVDDSRDPGEST